MKGSLNSRKEGAFSSVTAGRTGNDVGGSFYENEETKKAFSDRMNYVLVNSIGGRAVVTIPSGVKYSGMLLACNATTSNGVDVILKYPRIIDKGIDEEDAAVLSAQLKETLLIEGDDVAELELLDVDFSLDDKWEQIKRREEQKARERRDGKLQEFRTDTDIAGAGEVKERELQKWTPDDSEAFALEGSLEDHAEEWDQFAVNEQKFGITSTFDEYLYTTKINKGDPNYETRLKEADRIAREIEAQGTAGNVHLAEERGIVVDDSGMDEEDKYSGVDRRGDELLAQLKMNAKPALGRPTKYVPPSLRNEPHNADPAILSSTKKGWSPPAPKSPVDKKIQLDELKKFSEKFKVPYKMPEDVKTIFKKSEELPSKSPSALKVNPSLPPKPTPQPASSTATPSITPSKTSNRNSKPSTPASSKVELKRPQNKFGPQSGHTPSNSPSAGRANTYRRRNNPPFFGDDGPKCLKKDFKKNFNVFLKSKEAFESRSRHKQTAEGKAMDAFLIEKPYFTTPTWISTMDRSFRTLFPDERTAIQKAQLRLQHRIMNAIGGNMPMGSIPGMMAMPVGPAGSQSTPFMASPGMFMPFQPQPMFYPPVPQMLTMVGGPADDRRNSTHSPSPTTNSPHGAPAFINGAPIGPFGYPAAFQPIMAPVGTGNVNGVAGPNGNGSNYKNHYHHHNNGNRYHRHR
ncbi:AAL139Cp [Eremothecium gossypii ATCC 10895]|uniref:AAL139Cp n=1 Tax=Eremothecium gossypii (strain ATCC 10895 / CBS 109.51 / FGSC 9923 / NRRL Y-1056) TaxID=284811 RepID=Q75F67_EREGS|nr:AAL139Cp [Eremothecium gossypii ATCC 10895]AAS50227.1 AAL139Cp [Eremothecium gossypii ATCC 10895]AEY94512.1 FAAL139Cp [Eremothecium gossypii FDAG1]